MYVLKVILQISFFMFEDKLQQGWKQTIKKKATTI